MVQIENSISDLTITKNSESRSINVFDAFTDDNDSDRELQYTVVENSNPDVVSFSDVDQTNGTLDLSFGEVGISDLTIQAEDSEGNIVTDSFRVKVTGEDAFTIAVLPDTQDYPLRPELNEQYPQMTQWLADNKDNLNIDFVIHVGDIVFDNTLKEWEVADEAMSILDGQIPYSLLPGNHDMGEGGLANIRSTDLYNATFPLERYEDTATFGGVYDGEPDRYDNNYHTFEAPDGTDWLVLSLEFAPREDVIRWANDVLEDHRDHRAILVTHNYMNFDEKHQDPLDFPLFLETGGYDYGLINDPENAVDGETIWRDLVSQNPNVTMTFSGHIFGDGATQLVGYGEHGTPVYQLLNNYQDGVATEITGNGDPKLGENGGNGALRLVTIDPTENTITEETFFVTLDEYIVDGRVSSELNRDGLTGDYVGHEIVFEDVELDQPETYLQAKAGDDLFVTAEGEVAEVTLDGSNSFNPDGEAISYLWQDKTGNIIAEEKNANVSLPVGKHSLTLTVENAAGLTNRDEILVVVSGDRTLLVENFNDGDIDGWTTVTKGDKNTDKFVVKGTVASRSEAEAGLPAPEGQLHIFPEDFRMEDISLEETADTYLFWDAEDAFAWQDYVIDATFISYDDDTAGLLFYYQDEDNYYKLTLDTELNLRTLTKVLDGEETILATATGGYQFNQTEELQVAVVDNEITATLNGNAIFDGGAITDTENPLTGGTVALYSRNQDSLIFDDVTVNQVVLTANAEGESRVSDSDASGLVEVDLTAASSYTDTEITEYSWSLGDSQIASGETASVDLPLGLQEVTLTVTDNEGNTDTDILEVAVYPQDSLLIAEDFTDSSVLNSWTVVDEGEPDLEGNEPEAADWQITDGALIQNNNVFSRQLAGGGDASPEDPWNSNWSPHGDGWRSLRKGTFVFYEGEGASNWSDYSVETNILTPDDGGVGILFHYQDENNYYKLEIDSEERFVQLFKLVDGYETTIARTRDRYTSNEEFNLRIDIQDQKIQAYLNDEEVFAYAYEDRDLTEGTVGLYTWNSEGVQIKDLTVLDLSSEPAEELNTLPNGVASGDTTQNSTVLWTRSTVLGAVTFEYSTNPHFNEIEGTAIATANDPNVPVKVLIEDLQPDTQYYYRVTNDEGEQLTGQLTTPAPEGEQSGLRFGFINCNNQNAVPLISMRNIPEQNLDFLLNYGDTVYQDDAVATAPELPVIATSLDDMRAKYGEVYGEYFGLNPYADARGSTSVYSMIDDHEVINNFSGGGLAELDERFPETEGLINDTELYQNGLQAFNEYAPINEQVYQETGDPVFDGKPNLYRFETFGSDAALINLDTRSFRDDFISDRSETFLEDSLTQDRTILGETQLETLKKDLLEADAKGLTWKFIATPVEIQQWGTLFAEDRWEGYAKERNEILQFIDENDIDNVVFLAGDWHGYNVNNLTYQTEPGVEQIATNAFEVVVGSGGSNPYGPGWTGTADLTAEEQELFDSLPIAPDNDSEIDDKDDFTKLKVIDAGMEESYDPMGLNNNLPQAEGLIDAELIEGDYVGNFHLSWSEFDIDEKSQQLTVTTYGILPYEYEDIAEDPSILERQPEVISKFVVNPQVDFPDVETPEPIFGTKEVDTLEIEGSNNLVFADEGNDLIDTSLAEGNNRIYGDGGDDTFIMGKNDQLTGAQGADSFFATSGGDNTITGGAGADQFWIANAEIPESANIITDFTSGEDVIGIAGLGIGFDDLSITQDGDDALIGNVSQDLAILTGVNSTSLSADNFAFA